MVDGRDTWWHDEMDKVTADCDCEWVESEHPLFMLYTSGSTGKPKGIVHTTAGYMLGAWSTFKYTFDYKPGEVYWCTADIGWITGHSYIVYGPLLERATTVMFEGVPTYPDAGPVLGRSCDRSTRSTFLHRARPRARADEGGRRVRPNKTTVVAALAGHGRRADQSRRRGVVLRRRRRARVPDRGHVVADGDGRHHDRAAAGGDADEAGQRHASVLRASQPWIWRRQGSELEGEAQGFLAITKPWPSASEACWGDQRALRVRVLLHVQGLLRHRRRLPPRRGRLLLDHRPRRRRHQRRPGTAWAPRRSSPRWCCTRRAPRPRSSACPRGQGRRDLLLSYA